MAQERVPPAVVSARARINVSNMGRVAWRGTLAFQKLLDQLKTAGLLLCFKLKMYNFVNGQNLKPMQFCSAGLEVIKLEYRFKLKNKAL